jgi:hypothetical protein
LVDARVGGVRRGEGDGVGDGASLTTMNRPWVTPSAGDAAVALDERDAGGDVDALAAAAAGVTLRSPALMTPSWPSSSRSRGATRNRRSWRR